VTGLTVLVAIVLGYLVIPAVQEMIGVSRRLSVSRQRLAALERMSRELEVWKERVPEAFSDEPPATSDSDVRLLDALQKHAVLSGLKVKELRPGITTRSSVMTLDIKVRGGMDALVRFLYALDAPASNIRLKKLSLSARAGSPDLDVAMTCEAAL
jgi:hypothetical protein